ncbi:histone deacetylase [Rhodocytophaga aerolata]|uniref:Histone deacetylase n=1 Tax=Rhodocytophaga aerolata TaxID=455078 RepID=A0ABT8R4Y4_9BACT|nr:histone deacetylase [Rhodocytophaga aerolata]MDO1445705.1 histone deacetylase [Rhodocytophaga aerolata]
MIKIAYSDRYLLDLPKDHKFPIQKYALIKDQLLYEGTIEEANLYDTGLCTEEQVLAVHTQEYWHKIKSLTLDVHEVRRIGLPLNQRLVDRSLSSSCGTLKAAVHALEDGISLNIAGGTHHAFTYKGEGFCVLNDLAIAACHLLQNQLASKILVVDLDVHQGNGTAEIFQNNSQVFTFSMHGADNYPLKKEVSDLDIPLKAYTTDSTYLQILRETLPKLIEEQKPDFIFYQSGVDVLDTDKLGKLALTRQGCRTRDQTVLELCAKKQIPVAVAMGGGYSERMADIVEAHCNTFRVAFDIFG